MKKKLSYTVRDAVLSYGTTVADVIETSGVAYPTLRRWFSEKAPLFQVVCMGVVARKKTDEKNPA